MKILFLFSWFLWNAVFCEEIETCDLQWVSYDGGDFIIDDGVTAGDLSPGVKIYVGRIKQRDGKIIGGRIERNRNSGLHVGSLVYPIFIDSGFDEQLEYLKKTPGYTFKWVTSKGGEEMTHFVSPGYTAGQDSIYFGRTRINGKMHFGQVYPNTGLVVYPAFRSSEFVVDYEILTCIFDTDYKPNIL